MLKAYEDQIGPANLQLPADSSVQMEDKSEVLHEHEQSTKRSGRSLACLPWAANSFLQKLFLSQAFFRLLCLSL